MSCILPRHVYARWKKSRTTDIFGFMILDEIMMKILLPGAASESTHWELCFVSTDIPTVIPLLQISSLVESCCTASDIWTMINSLHHQDCK